MELRLVYETWLLLVDFSLHSAVNTIGTAQWDRLYHFFAVRTRTGALLGLVHRGQARLLVVVGQTDTRLRGVH